MNTARIIGQSTTEVVNLTHSQADTIAVTGCRSATAVYTLTSTIRNNKPNIFLELHREERRIKVLNFLLEKCSAYSWMTYLSIQSSSQSAFVRPILDVLRGQ